MTISSSIRAEVLEKLKSGISARAISRELSIGVKTAISFRREFLDTGAVKTREWRRDPKVSDTDTSDSQLARYSRFINDAVEANPNGSLKSFTEALEKTHGLKVHRESINRFLKRVGYTFS